MSLFNNDEDFNNEIDSQHIIESFQCMFVDNNCNNCNHHNLKKFTSRDVCPDCGYTKCHHIDVYKDDSGILICRDCKEELNQLDFKQEWTYYGQSDNRSSKDPSRCHKTKTNQTGIRNVFKDKQIHASAMMLDIMENKYKEIVNKTSVSRGVGRNSIIAAILFYTYQEFGEFRTAQYIRSKFTDLKQTHMSSGIAKYLEVFPEARNINITAEILIPWFMKRINIDQSHHSNILYINNYIKNTSKIINRSNPQSIAAAVIYFYLCINSEYREELGIKRKSFAEKTDLSDITITKLVREISDVAIKNNKNIL